MSSISRIVLSLIALTLSASPALAQEGPAGSFLERRHGAINRILARAARTPEAETAQKDEVTEILRELLDLEAMGRAALGDHWEEHSEEERERFVLLLRQLVERSYRRNLENTSGYHVDYGQEEARGERLLLHTTARDRRNRRAPEITIDYLVRPTEGGFVVEDITTDGVSMVRNYRSQFSRIIRRDGWDALIERMETRLENDDF